jgi:hypothetical protein
MAFLGAGCVEDAGWQDDRAGLIVRPMVLVAHPSMLDAVALRDACLAWAQGTPIPPFECRVDQETFLALEQDPGEALESYEARRAGTVRLWVEALEEGTWGLTEAHVDRVTRETVWAEIRVSDEVAYDRASSTAVIAHELGETVGLAHDPDLGSCMHDPVPVPCTIQDEDLARAQGR